MEHRWGNRRQVILRVRLRTPEQNCAMGWLTDLKGRILRHGPAGIGVGLPALQHQSPS